MVAFASVIMSTFDCYYGIYILEPRITFTERKGPTDTRSLKIFSGLFSCGVMAAFASIIHD